MKEKIVIFGNGFFLHTNAEQVKKEYEVVAILDNSVNEARKTDVFGCTIYPFKEVERFTDVKIMCMSVIYFVEMAKQLFDIGISPGRIEFGLNYFSSTQSYLELFGGDGKLVVDSAGDVIYKTSMYGNWKVETRNDFEEIRRKIFKEKHEDVKLFLDKFSVYPVSSIFGCERGKAVDRYYIEKYLKENENVIKGDAMEIASDEYIKKYGGAKVSNSFVMHKEGANGALKIDFETGEGIRESMLDCLICTQTLQYIYDLKSAVHNIYRMLKYNGVALFSFPGIKSLAPDDSDKWGEYWSFTVQSVRKLLTQEFGEGNVCVEAYGNVKVTMAYLYGICLEDMNKEELDVRDSQFPFLITAKAKKE